MVSVLKTGEVESGSLRRLRIPPPPFFGTCWPLRPTSFWLLGEGAPNLPLAQPAFFDPNGAMKTKRVGCCRVLMLLRAAAGDGGRFLARPLRPPGGRFRAEIRGAS